MDMTHEESGIPDTVYRNPDGSLATWMEPLPLNARRNAAIRWAAGGALLALLVWLVQHLGGYLVSAYFFIGLVPLALGILSARLVYDQKEARRFSMAKISYTTGQRLRRAAPLWAFGVVMVVVIAAIQFSLDTLETYWYYGWPALIPVLVGTWRYLKRGEVAMTPAAAEAKKELDAREAARAAVGSGTPDFLEKFIQTRWFRYPAAIALGYGAYYLGFESEAKYAMWGAIGLALMAVLSAHEISVILLGIGVAAWIGVTIFTDLSTISVGGTIIVGVIIIAAAIRKQP